jgi:hypothetical protein
MKVRDYGDFISKALKKKLVAYECFGSYSGEWIAVLEDGDNYEFWKGSYGSCSGCDDLENWDYEVPEDRVGSYFEEKPFIVIPKSVIENCSKEDFVTLMPRNIGTLVYDFDPETMYKALQPTKGE